MENESQREPWLRETHTELDPLRRQVVHALELAAEDITRWCAGLSDAGMSASPFGVAPVGFHLRHMARSLDRLLTYAEGKALDERQRTALVAELQQPMAAEAALKEALSAIAASILRVLAVKPDQYEQARYVGRDRIPTTCGGLLIHVAEHTQRHVGQAITTAKVVRGLAFHDAEKKPNS